MHVFLVFLCFTANALTQAAIEGSANIDAAELTRTNTIRVTVYSRHGALIETAPVKIDGTFTLYLLPKQSDGVYVLHLLGSMTNEYAPLLLNLRAGSVTSVISRPTPLLIAPESEEKWPSEYEVKFVPQSPSNYVKNRSWSWSDLWAYKSRFLLLLAVAFVVWFPRVIQDLPKELREELTGEKEPELGDANAHFKALLGRTDIDVTGASPPQN